MAEPVAELTQEDPRLAAIEAEIQGKPSREVARMFLAERDAKDKERLAKEKAEAESRKDFKTGLLNERGLDHELSLLEGEHSRHFTPAQIKENPNTAILPGYVLIFDADGLHDINTKFSLAGGDELLKAIANSLNIAASRSADLKARLGEKSDEFAVILPHIDLKGTKNVIEEFNSRLRLKEESLQTESNGAYRGITLSASIGIAAFGSESGRSPKEAVLVASKAMGEEKAKRRRELNNRGAHVELFEVK